MRVPICCLCAGFAVAGCSSGSTLAGGDVPDGGDVAPDGGDDGSTPEGEDRTPAEIGEGSPPPPADGGLGDTGWRDSTEPWVPPAREPERMCNTYDVWSNDSAVYVLMDWQDTDGGPPSDIGEQISVNDGSGWREFYSVRSTTAFECSEIGCIGGIAGMIGGRLVSENGTLAYVGPGTYEPEGGVSGPVEDAFVVNDTLAYAIWQSMGARVIRWDGSHWGPVPAVLPYEGVIRLWADADDLFVVGEAGTVLSLEAGDWRIHDAGTLDPILFIWGFDGNDVWIASWDELWHYDGTAWTAVPWPFPDAPADYCVEGSIQGLWGADGRLFVWTSHRLVLWDGSEFRTLGHWPARHVVEGTINYCRGGLLIAAVWGNAPDEVFLATNQGVDDVYRRCPEAYLLYWDGAAFHWF